MSAAYLTSPKDQPEGELVSEDVLSSYRKLNNIIVQMNIKVEHVIEKHES